jgi:hypothetical protein
MKYKIGIVTRTPTKIINSKGLKPFCVKSIIAPRARRH